MTLSTAGLTNTDPTTNFLVQYDDTLPNLTNAKAVANALLAVIENEFTALTGPNWYNIPSGKFGTSKRVNVRLEYLSNDPDSSRKDSTKNSDGWGAINWGYPDNTICLDPQNSNSNAADAAARVEMLFIAEFVEILMGVVGNWNAGDSSGEGLSQFSDIQRFQSGHYSYYGSVVDSWLNGASGSPNAARSDWVNKTFTGSGSTRGDGDSVSFGCALAFLFYLKTQLGFSDNQIIANYKSNLASIYKALTGDAGDPFPFFLNLISSVYPASSTASIPGPVSDNPFPIAIVSFADSKNTFGLDEAKDIVNNQGGLVSGAFWVMVDGFSKQSFNALNITANNNFSGAFYNLPGVQISPNPIGPQFQAGVNDTTPQRIGIPFDIILTSPFLKQNPGTYTLSVSLTTNGTSVSGATASTQFELLAGADPYFSNIDVNQDNEAYLSQDLRVFTATPAQKSVPIPGGPALSDSVNGAYQYIRDLLAYLNSTASFTNPKGTDPFTSVFPDQYGANQSDSSVTPFSLDTSSFPFIQLDNNYNFAVARVRLQGSSGTAGEAKSVRVFFRLFSTQSNDTDYDTNTTYPFTPDTSGKPGSPLVGSGNTTIPFFASGNFSSQQDYGSGGPNIFDIEIPDHQDGVYHYYGCFLNFYDTNNIINGQQVQALLNGTHHCLVAQIAYDDAPIPQGVSPLSWDQLAQRNLQVTLSDNPGGAASHRIPQTFDCRPSGAIVLPGGDALPVPPDELMIDWGAIPPGSVASLYWPQVNASDVLSLANQLYSVNPLTTSDSHTIKLKVTKGLSYIPIPSGAGENFAGLFTIDLPPSKVSSGQTFNIVVRRLSSKTYTPPPPIQAPPQTQALPSDFREDPSTGKGKNSRLEKAKVPTRQRKQPPAAPSDAYSWRYIVGSFKVQIPVTTASTMLPLEENTLAIMKWRLQQMAPSDRWYPVLERYISYIAARVDGLGGDSASILLSPNGVAPKQIVRAREHEYTGKVCEVLFDCFGNLEGFVLDNCHGMHTFKTRQDRIGELVLRACKDQLLLSVYVRDEDEQRIDRLIIRC